MVDDERVFIMGAGVDLGGDFYKMGIVQVFDVPEASWSVMDQEMPIAGGACFADEKRIIVLGGYHSGRRPQARVALPDGFDIGEPEGAGKFVPRQRPQGAEPDFSIFSADHWFSRPPKTVSGGIGHL